eukprot:1146078-Pyramimonas_sp.AAC.1
MAGMLRALLSASTLPSNISISVGIDNPTAIHLTTGAYVASTNCDVARVLNLIWEELKRSHVISAGHVKGHSGHPWN